MTGQSFVPGRHAGVPDFKLAGVVFTCWVAVDQEGTPYVWRSACSRIAVGRNGALCWVRVDGVLLGREFESLKTAMGVAVVRLAAKGEQAA